MKQKQQIIVLIVLVAVAAPWVLARITRLVSV